MDRGAWWATVHRLARDCAQLWESLVPRTQQSSSQGSDGEKQPLLSPTEELYRNQMLTEQKGRYRPEAVWSESARFMQPLCIYDTRTDSIMLSGTYTGLNLNQFQVEGQNCHNTGMRPLFPCQALRVLKNWCFWTVVLEKTLESPLDCKEIQAANPKGDQSWVFIGRTDAEAETPVLWPPHAKSWLIGKESDAGRDCGQEEKGTTEDEMAGWHHWLDGRESEWTPGDSEEQRSPVCCSPWGHKESDTTEWLHNNITDNVEISSSWEAVTSKTLCSDGSVLYMKCLII